MKVPKGIIPVTAILLCCLMLAAPSAATVATLTNVLFLPQVMRAVTMVPNPTVEASRPTEAPPRNTAVPPGPTVVSSLPAFPGAEGFGANTVGGRGGQVIEVTNLNDSGPGSLRACVEASGPRTCVFRVAGTITLSEQIRVRNPYLTVAGQTAPGGGITLRIAESSTAGPLLIETHDVVIRYIRSRPGPGRPIPGETDSNIDAITMADWARSGSVYNIVIDHSSFSWATDENVNAFYDARDITIQWSIVSEALYCPKFNANCYGKGMLIGSDNGGNISIHHNLFASNVGRNPMVQTEGAADVVNNVILAPRVIAAVVSNRFGYYSVNFVGNLVKAPVADGQVYGLRNVDGRVGIYVQGNIGPYRTSDNQPQNLIVDPRNNARANIIPNRVNAPPVTTSSAFDAYDQVLAGAGATIGLNCDGTTFYRRDSVDQRAVDDVRNDRDRVIDDPSEVGGWPSLAAGSPCGDSDHDGMPDVWEQLHGFDPNNAADNNQDADSDGYTNLEEFLNVTAPRTPSEPPRTPTPAATNPATSTATPNAPNTATVAPSTSTAVPSTPTPTPVPPETPVPTPTGEPSACGTGAYFVASGGEVVMEAEHYTSLQAGSGSAAGHSWQPVTTYSGYTGSAAMQALPNSNYSTQGSRNGPVMLYQVEFQTPGRYFVFLRGYAPPQSRSNDSVHVGLDGSGATATEGLGGFTATYSWRNHSAGEDTFVFVPAPGRYTFYVWMREDGVVTDKIWLSTTRDVVSSGDTAAGPAESACATD